MDSKLGSAHLNVSAKSPENHIGVKLPASIRGAGSGGGLHRAGLEVGHVGHQVEVVTAGHAAQLLENLCRTSVDQSHRRLEGSQVCPSQPAHLSVVVSQRLQAGVPGLLLRVWNRFQVSADG